MPRKSDTERLEELDKKIEEMKAKKQQIDRRVREKERKARTRRLIQVGAIFEDHFNFQGQEKAQQYALALEEIAKKHKEKIETINVEKSKKDGQIIYEEAEEKIIVPAQQQYQA